MNSVFGYTRAQRDVDRALIFQLDATISQLRRNRAKVQRLINAYIYPINTIPAEMLARIFFHCLPAYPTGVPVDGKESVPTQLAQVCRHWRRVAHHAPNLWRSPLLDGDTPDKGYTSVDVGAVRRIPESRLEFFETWLIRSHPLPLSITLPREAACPVHAAAVETFRDEALRIAMKYTPRWERISFLLPRVLPRPLDKNARLPLLYHLSIEYSGHGLAEWIPASLRSHPSLQSLRLMLDTAHAHRACLPLFPWTTLVQLDLGRIDPCVAGKVLLAAPALRRCRVILARDEWSKAPTDCVHLPHLDTLILGGIEADHAFAFLRTLRTPCLKRLGVPTVRRTEPVATLREILTAFCGCQKLTDLFVVSETRYDLLGVDPYRSQFGGSARISAGTMDSLDVETWGYWEPIIGDFC